MSGEATIRRGVRNARYAAIPNHVFEDTRLSMEARWLLSYLLSKPDNWTVVIGDIVKKGGCGRDRARKMIAELVALGYAEREQQREDGRFGASVLVIFDEPRELVQPDACDATGESVAFLPQTEIPATETPAPVSPSPVKSAHSNNSYLANTDLSEREGAPESISSADRKKIEKQFEKWWLAYPEAKDSSRNAAITEWFAFSDEERAECLAKSPAFIDAAKARKAKFVYASVFLSERKWRLIDDKTSEFSPPTPFNPFSRAWMGLRLFELSRPATMTGWPVLTAFQQAQSRDPDGARKVHAERLARYGWPKVASMADRAASVPGHIATASECFRQVEASSALADAWRDLHQRNGWPWLPTTRHEWLYLPPIEDGASDLLAAVEAALSKFLNSISKGRSDDAA